MVVFALTLTVFIGAMMLGVDLSRLRAEAENAQRVANASALAGVVFLPNFPSSAYSRATSEAKKNGFVSTTTNGVVISPTIDGGYSNRLKVTVTEPVSLVFGKIFGLGPRTISRTSVAEFAEPLEMGASDYVLGYAPFPTSIVTPTSAMTPTQGFYLMARGPYGQQENGDAYSQYFESFNNGGLNPSGSNSTSYTDPCSTNPTSDCSGLTTNPDRKAIGFNGYDFVVDNPFTHTLVVKIFDPFDEGPLDTSAITATNKPSNHLPPAPYNNGLPDQYSCAAGNTHICDSPAPYPVALNFTLTGPYQTTYDTTPKPVVVAPANSLNTAGTVTCGADCVLSNNSDGSFTAGDDPTHTACMAVAGMCGATPSPYAYKFLNYAIITHQGLYHIHVTTGLNTTGPGEFLNKYGNGGNAFGLAACADPVPVLGTFSNPGGSASAGYPATSDPAPGISGGSGSATWDPNSCPNPNSFSGAPAACAHPGTAPADTCVHIYAVNRMCVYNNLQGAGSSHASALVPLGYVPPAYAGKTLHIRLYDVGDISTHDSPATSASANNSVEVLTPAGDLTHNTSIAGSFTTNTPPSSTTAFSSTLDYYWDVAPTKDGAVNTSSPGAGGSGYVDFHPNSPQYAPYTQPVGGLGQSSGKYNGSWVNMDVPIPPKADSTHPNGYDAMVAAFGGYWKMLYDIGPHSYGNDTTTWEISVDGSPVHLVE